MNYLYKRTGATRGNDEAAPPPPRVLPHEDVHFGAVTSTELLTRCPCRCHLSACCAGRRPAHSVPSTARRQRQHSRRSSACHVDPWSPQNRAKLHCWCTLDSTGLPLAR